MRFVDEYRDGEAVQRAAAAIRSVQRRPWALMEIWRQDNTVLVLVALGGNDMLRHIPRQQTISSLEQILAQIKAHGAKALLLATPYPNLMAAVFQLLSVPDFYRKITDEQQVPLIEDAIAELLSEPN